MQMLPKDDAGWTPCEAGTLFSTIARVRSKRRQANLLRLGACTFAGAFVLVVASFYFSPNSIDLECRNVGGLLADYVADNLDQESRQFVKRHLFSCENCRMKLREIQAGEMATQTVRAVPSPVYQVDLLLSAIQPMPLAID
jgi:hypothetical protein